MKYSLLGLIVGCVISFPLLAQNIATPLITGTIDETKQVVLHGNVHPLAQLQYDRGAVPNSFPAERILLLLDRPADREAALQSFLVDVHRRGSTSYHQWLTPEEFGDRFGPADSDIQAAESWLASHGLNVSRVTKAKQAIEFSGTAGQMRDAFHTEIHQYIVQGEKHYANATEVSIPAALAPLIRGLSPLNDFHAKPQVRVAGKALYSRETKRTTPQWTMPNPFGTANLYAFAVAPQDFATQYDLAPLYQAGVSGTGQTIGIIDVSDIDINLVSAYQELFGLPNNPPQVVIDGGDPGTLTGNGSDVEAYLDVEMSSAVAPGATVNLYIADGNGLQDPLVLATTRAIEDNQASVLSLSFGACEWELGNAGNQMWNGLWEEAAAQGQTVLVGAGDSGSQCDIYPDSVSGLASTPWNVAVGGTDFYYSDYATGGASANSLWNQTNDPSLGSLKAPLTEQVWNDGFGLNVLSGGDFLAAGGGGASSCSTQLVSGYTGTCDGGVGYAKPAWQSGPGVPADGVRDLPDVSLFASSGSNLSAAAICAEEGECAPGTDNATGVLLVGGTSVSSPLMAGIMALVDQKYGRQGQADFTLYPLAQQKAAAFHDITLGNNTVECWGTDIPGCARDYNFSEDVWVTTQYSAGPNYDLASGLGSVDASVLVNNWGLVSERPTSTTLSLSSANIVHGTAVTVTTSVAPITGSGTPTGGVSILTNSPLPANQSQTVLPLSDGTATSSIDTLPGGLYQVTAEYSGDGVYSGSSSSPVTLAVSPENSNINFELIYDGSASNSPPYQYNQPLVLSIQPIGVNAPFGKTDGNATGSATFTVDTTSVTVPLNSMGVANWTPPALAPGSHTASASYSGDQSFIASSQKPVNFVVSKGYPWMNDSISTPSGTPNSYGIDLNPGSSVTVTVEIGPDYGNQWGEIAPPGTAAPTGTVTVCLGISDNPCYKPNYSQTVTLTAPSGVNAQYSLATVTFPNLAAGYYVLTATYNGDANWSTDGLVDSTEINIDPVAALAASTTSLSITPTTFSGSQQATLSTTVAGSASLGPPTGWVNYYNDGNFLTYAYLTPASTGATSSIAFNGQAAWFWNSGANQVTAIYQGDGNYSSSTSNVVNITATQIAGGGDFTLTPSLTQITLQSGGSRTISLNLASLNNFNGVVSFSCVPTSANLSCAVSPSSTTLTETATVTLTIQAAAQAAAAPSPSGRRPGWLGSGSLVLGCVVLLGAARRSRRLAMLFSMSVIAVLLAAVGCGGGGSQQAAPQNQTYSVLVNATASGILHNSKITVIVP